MEFCSAIVRGHQCKNLAGDDTFKLCAYHFNKTNKKGQMCILLGEKHLIEQNVKLMMEQNQILKQNVSLLEETISLQNQNKSLLSHNGVLLEENERLRWSRMLSDLQIGKLNIENRTLKVKITDLSNRNIPEKKSFFNELSLLGSFIKSNWDTIDHTELRRYVDFYVENRNKNTTIAINCSSEFQQILGANRLLGSSEQFKYDSLFFNLYKNDQIEFEYICSSLGLQNLDMFITVFRKYILEYYPNPKQIFDFFPSNEHHDIYRQLQLLLHPDKIVNEVEEIKIKGEEFTKKLTFYAN